MSITEQSVAIPTATAIPSGTWKIDPVHSGVSFAVKYGGAGTFRGTFDEIDAKLVDAKVEGSAKVASVRVNDANLAGHLQSPDFFDAEQHPELRLVSNSIERSDDIVTIEGDLTLRGVTKPVTISGTVAGPTADAYGNERIAFDVETTVNRRDFGINWNLELPTGEQALDDRVKITANLALVQGT